ncbi:hypothetical protein JKP88DRAFT_264347 [Tribonema minus]|uniref:FAD-binding FR-type domain-containing protein n=1 Tax=Tribonema minus TaxID=303371 RepID=A0A835YPD7_9STRA|nr:hypothetical protein JKP88DRAFT_264347 [Tribonema minus]
MLRASSRSVTSSRRSYTAALKLLWTNHDTSTQGERHRKLGHVTHRRLAYSINARPAHGFPTVTHRSISFWSRSKPPIPTPPPPESADPFVKDGAFTEDFPPQPNTAFPTTVDASPPAPEGQSAGNSVEASSGSVDAGFDASVLDTVVNSAAADGSSQSVAAAAQTVLTEAPFAELGHFPSDYAIRLVEAMHCFTGLPYWQSIAVTTVLLRLLLLPLQLRGMRVQVTMKEDQKAVQDCVVRIRDALAAKREEQYLMLWGEHVANSQKSMGNMGRMLSGGYSWFLDLNALDTTYQLPGMAGLALLVTVLTIPVDTANPAGSILASKVYGVPVAKLAMGGGMAALLAVFGSWMPAGVLVYWVANNTFGATQALLLRSGTIRTALNLPPLPGAGGAAAATSANTLTPFEVQAVVGALQAEMKRLHPDVFGFQPGGFQPGAGTGTEGQGAGERGDSENRGGKGGINMTVTPAQQAHAAHFKGIVAVQQRAGTLEEASGILGNGWLSDQIKGSGLVMLDSKQQEIFVSSVDPEGRVWASALYGPPGFINLRSYDTHDILSIQPTKDHSGLSWAGDGFLEGITKPGSQVGCLFMDQGTAKRYRVSGRVLPEAAADKGPVLNLQVTAAMGNCPKYVQRKALTAVLPRPAAPPVHTTPQLTDAMAALIRAADTAILGTANPGDGPEYGAHCSNRGGNPGFVEVVDASTLRFPEYRGNNLFLSLGSITSYPRAALLFIDRENGDMLQVTGTAEIEWGDRGQKSVRIGILEARLAKGASPHRKRHVRLSEFNPALPQRSPSPLTAAALNSAAASTTLSKPAAAAAAAAAPPRLRLAQVIDAAEGIKHFRFTPVDGSGGGAPLDYTPGQFATFDFDPAALVCCRGGDCGDLTHAHARSGGGSGSGGDAAITRSWTITSLPQSGHLEITVKRAAAPSAADGLSVSQWLHDTAALSAAGGETLLSWRGVGGDFTVEALGTPRPKLLLLTAGIGITPAVANLRWMLQGGSGVCRTPGAPPHTVLLHTTRTLAQVPFLAELSEMVKQECGGVAAAVAVTSKHPDRDSNPSPTSASEGGVRMLSGRVSDDVLLSLVPDVTERTVMLCGPQAFMSAADAMLRRLGVPAGKIVTEEFYF